MAKKGGFAMSSNIKIIPVSFEIDLNNPEKAIKVQYVVELKTSVYNDIMSSGVTFVADENTMELVDKLADSIANKINQDLGLQVTSIEETVNQEEEL